MKRATGMVQHTHFPIDVLGSRSLAIGGGWVALTSVYAGLVAYENEGKPEKAVAWSMISRGASPPKPPVG